MKKLQENILFLEKINPLLSFKLHLFTAEKRKVFEKEFEEKKQDKEKTEINKQNLLESLLQSKKNDQKRSLCLEPKRDSLEKEKINLLEKTEENLFASLLEDVYFISGIFPLEKIDLENRHVVFLLKDISELAFFLKEQNLDRSFLEGSCHVLLEEDLEPIKEIFWKYLFCKTKFIGFDSEMELFLKKLQMQITLYASDYRDLGEKVINNMVQNVEIGGDKVVDGTTLKDAFKGVPAIVCGAGPSLQDAIPLLKDWKGLLLAGGSSLGVLKKSGVKIDIAGAIDPDLPLQRIEDVCLSDTPFCYQSRLSAKVVEQIQGQKILFGDSGNYPIEKELTNLPFFEAGWNVSTFIIKVAKHLGCDPIIMVGMDFGYTDGKVYADGVVEKKELKEIEKNLLTDAENEMVFVSENGTSVKTREDLYLGKTFLEDLVEEFQIKNIWNATSSGLQVDGIKTVELERVIKKFKKFSRDKIEEIQKTLKSQKKVEFTSLPTFYQMIEFAKERVDRLLVNSHPVDEIELLESPIYTSLLLPFWEIWKHCILRHIGSSEKEIYIAKYSFFKLILKNHMGINN